MAGREVVSEAGLAWIMYCQDPATIEAASLIVAFRLQLPRSPLLGRHLHVAYALEQIRRIRGLRRGALAY
jgi:hypothetical protein